MSRMTIQSRKLAVTILVCSLGAITTHSVAATACPPGSHGSIPHCQPNQAGSHERFTMNHGAVSPSPAPISGRHRPAEIHAQVDPARVRPQSGAPVEHRSSAAQTHSIIFVGGKSAINSQPVPPGHSPDMGSINSQPVPPGRAVHKRPLPGNPVERTNHPEAKQN